MTTDEKLDNLMKTLLAIQGDLTGVKNDIGDIRISTEAVEHRVSNIEETTRKTDIRLENVVEPKIQVVLEQHGSIADDLRQVKGRLDGLEEMKSDVEVSKKVVTDHSTDIRQLKAAK